MIGDRLRFKIGGVQSSASLVTLKVPFGPFLGHFHHAASITVKLVKLQGQKKTTCYDIVQKIFWGVRKVEAKVGRGLGRKGSLGRWLQPPAISASARLVIERPRSPFGAL